MPKGLFDKRTDTVKCMGFIQAISGRAGNIQHTLIVFY